jgi:hypothetical protein
VETSVYSHDIFPIHGLYIHTNHLSLPSMQDMPQDEEYKQRSSVCRYRVLSAWKATQKDRLDQLTARDLVAALSSHEGAPYSPCRHPTEAVSGLTLACSQFDLNQGTWLFYKGNPCHADSQLLRPFPGLSG